MMNRNFLFLLAGQMVSQVGDKFHMIALSFWVLKTTGSSGKMGAVLAASLIPSLILGLFSGAVIDRYNRKFILVGTDLARGLIIAVFAGLFYFERMNFHVILVMQILLSANAAFFDPTIPSVIPQIVDEKDLAGANSRHQAVNGFSTVAGAVLGGICISMFGYFWVFVVNAVSFILSALLEYFIHIPPTGKKDPEQGRSGLFSDIKQGYQYVFSRRALVVLIGMVMGIHYFVGAMEVFMPVIASGISSDGAKTLGFFQGGLGLGGIMTAVGLSIWPISGKEKYTLFGSVFFIGLLYALAAFFKGNESVMTGCFLAMIFLFGGCLICAGISFKTLLQKNMDNHFAGRVFAVAGSVGNASIPGAMIFHGVLLEKYSVQGVLMVSGGVLMLLCVILFLMYKEETYDRPGKIVSKPLSQG